MPDNDQPPVDPPDDDTPVPPGEGPDADERDERERPPPSIVFPGIKEVKIVDGERKEADPLPDPHAETPPAGHPPVTGDDPAGGSVGDEATVIGPAPGSAPVSGREATIVGGDDQSGGSSLTGREATMVGDQGTPVTPLTGREATMVGGGQATPITPLSGRESTMVGPAGGEGGDAGTTVVGDDDGTQATIGPGSTMPGGDRDHTPPTYGGKPRTGVGSSASFDANWHLNGRKGPHTGQTWGDFELGGILGEGGMGAVYRAMQTSLKRRVAIKVLPPNLAQDSNLLQRFHLEASTASKLSSPHIVQVYFIGEHEGNHYYAMEFVEGTDLYDVFKDRRESDNPLAPEEASEFILQAARGLAEAGRYGVVHRDIKPPNLMVDKSGLVKIADFGIVKVLGDHQLTMTGQAVGTPAYCSPEQGRGDAEIDQRSDLYSLGVVFYELACGKKPFEATTPNALIYKHCFEEPELPKLLNASISNEIQAVILRLLQKKPENRYQSADELVRDLEALKTGAMLESALANVRGTGASEAKREQMNWFQRHLIPILVAAGLVIAAGAWGGYTYLQQRADEQLAARRATEELRPLLADLDKAAPLPAEVGELLDEYQRLSPDGAEDGDLQRWRAKVERVRGLQDRLAVLDDGADDAATRARAGVDLGAYTNEVGPDDAASQRWDDILTTLAAEEASLRDRLRELQTGIVTQGVRDQLAERVQRLAHLAGSDDSEVLQTRERIATFDQQVAGLTEQLSVLDETQAITESQRLELLAALGQLAPLVGDSDERILRWRQTLDQAGGLVARLRTNLTTTIGTSSRLPLATIEEVQADLDLFAELVDADDRDLQNWRAQIDASRKRVTARRSKLAELEARLDVDETLPAPVLPGLETTLRELEAQAGGDDADVLRWSTILRRSRTLLADLRERTERLSVANPEPITVAQREQLAAALDRLVAKEGIDPTVAERYRARLAAEQQRVAALRERLAPMDEARPFTAAMSGDLARLEQDLGGEGEDLERWLTKRDRILELRERLAVLDERRSVPENLDAQFASLRALVGPEAPEYQRWSEKVALIAALRERLAPLDRTVPLPENVDADLALWAEQVGTEDPTWLRYRAKVQRVRELKGHLEALAATLRIDPETLAVAHERLEELAGLVGIRDEDVLAAARRVEEIAGPPVPSWASTSGRDEFGLWADLPGGEAPMRLRYIPPGRFVMGSEEEEPGRDADEIPVVVTISRGFWIADAEVTQGWWRELMDGEPSFHDGPRRPVERVSLAEAEAFCHQLDAVTGASDARLPSEAEWELACRGGAPAPTGEERSQVAWYAPNSGERTQPVRQRYANDLGLYDMLGNVAEWTADSYGAYPTAAVRDPRNRGGDRQAVRGGSWGDPAATIRPANRIAVDPDVRSMYLGFRIAVPAAFDQDPDGTRLLTELARADAMQTFTLRIGEALLSLTLPGLGGEAAASEETEAGADTDTDTTADTEAETDSDAGDGDAPPASDSEEPLP